MAKLMLKPQKQFRPTFLVHEVCFCCESLDYLEKKSPAVEMAEQELWPLHSWCCSILKEKFVLRQGLTVKPSWSGPQESSCLSFPNAEITRVNHHSQP